MDRSIILMFCPGSSGLAWCSSNMVLCTIDWNAKLHRFGSSYIRPKKLWPRTSCHLCTGSLARNTFGQSANCSKNVVFPLPTLPSTNTVYGRSQYLLAAMSARVLEINSAAMSFGSRPGREVFGGWTRRRETGGAQRSNDVVDKVDRPRRRRQHKHNEFIAFNRQNALSPLTTRRRRCCCCCCMPALQVTTNYNPTV